MIILKPCCFRDLPPFIIYVDNFYCRFIIQEQEQQEAEQAGQERGKDEGDFKIEFRAVGFYTCRANFPSLERIPETKAKIPEIKINIFKEFHTASFRV